MSLVVMGASYKSAPIEVREHIAIPSIEVPDVLAALVEDENIREALVLSTCNRVEVYVDARTDRLGAGACTALFAQRAGGAYEPEHYYVHRGPEAVRHALRVVCSLDSQVLGEAQILGQMKRAFAEATECGTCGDVLTKLMKTAIELGKRARSQTGIGADSVSLSTTAFKAARNSVDDIASAKVVLIGAGEMARLTATYLHAADVTDVTVATRTYAHAKELADSFGMKASPFEERYALIAQADVVFTMTTSPSPVVSARSLATVLDQNDRGGRKLVIVDESVPRDVENSCAALPGVVLFDQETLTAIIDDGLVSRMQAVAEVERMVEQAEGEFLSWMQERLVVPTIKGIYQKAELVVVEQISQAQKEFEKQLGRQVTEDELQVLAAYGNAIVKTLMHGPVMRLRKESTSPDSYYYTGAARYLFGLDVFPPGKRVPCATQPCTSGRPCPIGLDKGLQPFCRAGMSAQ